MLSLALAFCCGAAARAQTGTDVIGNGGKHNIRGSIFLPSGRRADTGLKVRLVSTGNGDAVVFSDSKGSFDFRSLSPGSYTIIIESDDFEPVAERVYIDSDNISSKGGITYSPPRPYMVQIFLKPKTGRGYWAKPGVISAALAAVPKPALDLYYKALESSRKGQGEKAVEQFRQALALHADFALALRDLGAEYLKANQPDRAVEPLRASLKLDPEDQVALLDYGIALFQKKEYAAAEEHLRRALKKDARLAPTHYYLGVTLTQRHNLEEAEKELLEAIKLGGEKAMARAHFYLGGIYWSKRDFRRAADELDAYLRLVPDAPDADRLRTTIKELRSKP
jgi:Flp pilus assembly protein TadD